MRQVGESRPGQDALAVGVDQEGERSGVAAKREPQLGALPVAVEGIDDLPRPPIELRLGAERERSVDRHVQRGAQHDQDGQRDPAAPQHQPEPDAPNEPLVGVLARRSAPSSSALAVAPSSIAQSVANSSNGRSGCRACSFVGDSGCRHRRR